MAVSHEPYCDETHSPRQRCNDALAPTPQALNDLAPATPPVVEAAPEPATEAEAEADAVVEPSHAVREAVVAGVMPAPSPYATRAWEETARAIESGARDDAWEDAAEVDVADGTRAGSLAPVAIAAGVLAACVVVWRVARRRGGGDEG